jgi:hypothetical protein
VEKELLEREPKRNTPAPGTVPVYQLPGALHNCPKGNGKTIIISCRNPDMNYGLESTGLQRPAAMKDRIGKLLFPRMPRELRRRQMNMLIVSVIVSIPVMAALVFLMIHGNQ